jgi:hypothetical protein
VSEEAGGLLPEVGIVLNALRGQEGHLICLLPTAGPSSAAGSAGVASSSSASSSTMVGGLLVLMGSLMPVATRCGCGRC